jgi:hypothetical protein
MTDREKIDSLSTDAYGMILEFAKRGQVPILMVFAAPGDGFEYAHAVSPTGLDAMQVIKFLYEAKHYGRIQ